MKNLIRKYGKIQLIILLVGSIAFAPACSRDKCPANGYANNYQGVKKGFKTKGDKKPQSGLFQGRMRR